MSNRQLVLGLAPFLGAVVFGLWSADSSLPRETDPLTDRIAAGAVMRRVFVIYAERASLLIPVAAVVFLIAEVLDTMLRVRLRVGCRCSLSWLSTCLWAGSRSPIVHRRRSHI